MTADPSRKLTTLLRKLKAQHAELAPPNVLPEPLDEFDALVHQLLFSMLLWEASTTQAKGALKRIREAVVDYNELRVCIPDEVAHIIGDKYPLSHERALRLRSILNDIYQHQHSISLAHLPDLGKRESRQYLESLAGCPAFVAARVCLFGGLSHATPVDERLCDLLTAEGVLPEDMAPEAAVTWLEHHVKSEEARDTCLLLQAWSDEHGHPPKRDKRPVIILQEKPEPKAEAKEKPKAKKADKPEPKAKKPQKAKPRAGS